MQFQTDKEKLEEISQIKYLTITNLEYLVGLNYRAIKKRLGNLEPVKKDGKHKYYDAREAILRVFSSTETQKQFDLNQERARLAAMQADQKELEYHKQIGNLISSEHLKTGLTNLISSIRSHFLALPVTVAPRLINLETPEEVEHNLRPFVYEALEDLANADASKIAAPTTS